MIRLIEIGMLLGPVPAWDAPLWKKLLFFAVILICVMMLPGNSRKEQASLSNIVKFVVGALLIVAVVLLVQLVH
jgi:hypothetical protein